MTPSALTRKSWTDLTRRRARAVFAILTLAIAISSLGIFALTPILNRTMSEEVASSKLYDVQLQTSPLELTDADVAGLSALPNVRAVETRAWYVTRVYIGERREKALVIGVSDFARQSVDVVRMSSGEVPDTGSVAVDVQNSRQNVFFGAAGDVVKVLGSNGSPQPLTITGNARSLMGSGAVAQGYVTLYATPDTLSRLTGNWAIGSIELRLDDTRTPAANQTVEDVRGYLKGHTDFKGFSELPQIRESGSWPGKEIIDSVGQLFYVITVLALISGLFLISNTMSTLVAEQTGEIGVMKAIGGRRRQIFTSYLRTAMLMGAIGSLIGIPLGILLANWLAAYFAQTFYGVSASFAVDPTITLLALLVGLIGPALASVPAIRRATAVPVRQALSGAGGEAGADRAVDRWLRRLRLPRDAQIGVRNLGRSKRRTLGTTALVALAVANLLALLALGTSIANIGHQYWDDVGYDLTLAADEGSGSGRPLSEDARQVVQAMPGVEQVQPIVWAMIKLGDRDTFMWALPRDSMYDERLSDGRLFSTADEEHGGRVVLVENGLASASGIQVGDTVQLTTAAGTHGFDVIGLLDNSSGVMGSVYVPLQTAQQLLGIGDTANQFWIRTTSHEHGQIDRTTTRLEDAMLARGYSVTSTISYAEEEHQQAFTTRLTTIITVLGLLVVGISLIGLVNAMTANVLERTREIGIIRCIGGRSRDVRRIFATEGLAVALLGWIVGIPLGYILDVALMRVVEELLDVQVPIVFPLWNPLLALVGTMALSLLVMVMPLRRATRFRAGEALRYQ